MSPTPLSREQLADSFRAGCKPRHAWRIGTEHEKIAFYRDSLRPVPYEGASGIGALLHALMREEGWAPVFEAENIVALEKGGASITLEPGGQFELSGAPLATIFETCREAGDHLASLRRVGSELGIGFLGLAFQPLWGRDEIPWMPKKRYALMRNYMPKVGQLGLDMMLRTATVQANLDYESEADMAQKMRIAAALQPLVAALFAASPFVDGRPSGDRSYRSRVWQQTDPARTGIPAFIFRDHFGFEDYIEWALAAPLYFVIRNGQYIDCSGESFGSFLDGKLPQLPGERPSESDWQLHLTTLFPEVRLKQFLEMRGADVGGWPWICALPALWKGLLYDERAQADAMRLVESWSHAEVLELRRQVPTQALAAPFRGADGRRWCEEMVAIAEAGLQRLGNRNAAGQDESIFLAPLRQTLESGQTQADRWLAAYAGEWGGDIRRLFIEATHD